MADKDPAIWQARYVAEHGATTLRIDGLVADAPLRVTRTNLPIGANAGTDAYPLVVTGPYVKVAYALPEDVDGTFTGRVRVYRKSREFCRDSTEASIPAVDTDPAELVHTADYSADLGVLSRATYYDQMVFLDQTVDAGTLWYYTVMYEMVATAGTLWAYDPANSHSRGWAYKQHTRDGTPYSPLGDRMFDGLPRQAKILDAKEASNATYRFFQILGRMLDQVQEEIDVLKSRRFDVDACDFQELAYIDWLLAWPTNFELSEAARRRETEQAADLWKAKGTIDSLELAIQTVTGWNVNVVEGWPWVARTYDGEPIHDAASPPAAWNPATDGDWAELVEKQPSVMRLFDTTPEFRADTGLPGDQKMYLPDNTVYVENSGVGWWWQNPNGVLIVLEPVEDSAFALTETIVAKVARIAPLFALHYAAFSIAVVVESEESYQPLGTDELVAFSIDGLTEEEFDFIEPVVDLPTTDDRCELYTWPHPEYAVGGSKLGAPEFPMHHGYLIYTCGFVEDLDMPQHIHLTSDKTVTNAIPNLAPGQHKLDPTTYSGTRTFQFGATGLIGGPSAGLSMQVDLWDLDNAEVIATLAFNNVASNRVISPVLTVGSGVGEFKDSLTNYEVRVTLLNSVNPTDFGTVGNAFILVE